MAGKREKLDERQRKLERANEIIKGLAKHDVTVDLRTVSSDFDKYEKMLAEREGDSSESIEITEEQKQVIKSLDSYYEIFLQGTEEVYYDETIRRPTVIHGKVVEFFLAVVPGHLIESKTDVIEENKRDQKALNEYTLDYILCTLSVDGQQYEAEGYIDPDTGIIKVVDGSSRRMSCIIGNKPFRIWITREVITRKDLAIRSDRANDYKPLSFWETSQEYSTLKKEGLTNQEIADAKKVGEGRVSIGLGAVDEVPYEVYTSFQAGTGVVRTTIEWLVPAWRLLAKQNLTDAFLKEIKPFKESGLDNDKQVLTKMKRVYRDVLPDATKPGPAKGFVQKDDYQIKHKFDHDSGKATINIIDASPEVLSKLDAFIKEL